MMDECRRFQIALGGIAGAMGIAALVVSSGPPVSAPAVHSPRAHVAAPLLASPPPVGEHARVVAAVHRVARRPAATGPASAVVAPAPAIQIREGLSAPAPPPLPIARHAIVIAAAPSAESAALDLPDEASLGEADAAGLGTVGRAFTTAGREVGRGFAAVGRTVKRAF